MEDTTLEPAVLAFEMLGWVTWSIEWLPDYRLITGSIVPEEYRRPTADEWRTFWTAIDEADVWDWERSYKDDDGLCDACDWTLVLGNGKHFVRSRGDEVNRPPEWPSLLMALVVLADDESFIEFAQRSGAR